jgi:hypothetical protein
LLQHWRAIVGIRFRHIEEELIAMGTICNTSLGVIIEPLHQVCAREFRPYSNVAGAAANLSIRERTRREVSSYSVATSYGHSPEKPAWLYSPNRSRSTVDASQADSTQRGAAPKNSHSNIPPSVKETKDPSIGPDAF